MPPCDGGCASRARRRRASRAPRSRRPRRSSRRRRRAGARCGAGRSAGPGARARARAAPAPARRRRTGRTRSARPGRRAPVRLVHLDQRLAQRALAAGDEAERAVDASRRSSGRRAGSCGRGACTRRWRNGAGRSTTMRTCSRALRPRELDRDAQERLAPGRGRGPAADGRREQRGGQHPEAEVSSSRSRLSADSAHSREARTYNSPHGHDRGSRLPERDPGVARGAVRAHAGAAGRALLDDLGARERAAGDAGHGRGRLRPRPRLSRRASVHARRLSVDVPRQALDDAAVRGLRHRGGDERALPLPARPRPDGALDRLRHADADGLRLRPRALARRGRPGGRRDRLARGHADALPRDPARRRHRPR